ncbi:MAG: 5-formyltetrahydrofolate cyclo-ligase [Rhodospirillaceae bacterium]
MRRFNSKTSAREHVWDRMTEERVARFPFPIKGRIPNFVGAEKAAERLLEIEPWKSAKYLKINPDSPMRPLRLLALQRGITYFMPTPRLAAGFMKFDPSKIPEASWARAASLSSCKEYAELITLDELPQMDAIVAGSVAVTNEGYRCGKGAGYSDLEYSILLDLGHKPVPVATLIHDTQLVDVFPSEKTDLPLSIVVTPSRTIFVENPPGPPKGIDWARVSSADFDAMPVLRELESLVRDKLSVEIRADDHSCHSDDR